MLRNNTFLSSAFLTTALAFLAATPTQAQGIVSVGAGSYTSPSNPSQTSSFMHVIQEDWSGKVHGHGIWFFANATVFVDVTSYEYYEFTPGQTSLAYAGTISAIIGNPTHPLSTVGRTIFGAVNDNGWAAADETTGLSLLPPLAALPPVLPQFGTLSTIQELLDFFEYYGFPNPAWAPLLNGNILVR